MKSKLTIDYYGDKVWKLPNGLCHREGSPAIEYANGDKAWYINDKLHRENGPAVENIDGGKQWYLNGIKYTEQKYKNKMRSRKLNKLLK